MTSHESVAHTKGRITAIVLIGHPQSGNGPRDMQAGSIEVFRPDAFVSPERWTAGPYNFGSKCYCLFLSGAKALRILHIP